MSGSPCVLLVDNGSHRAESTLSLRRIASALTKKADAQVHPVSLLHSTKVDSAELDGEPAQIFEPFLKRRLEEGDFSFLIVPFFFGHSAAIYEYLPSASGRCVRGGRTLRSELHLPWCNLTIRRMWRWPKSLLSW